MAAGARRVLVTGAAGFIGSHLSEALTARGHAVTGVDAFTPYYDRATKEDNVRALRDASGFDLVEHDLLHADLDQLLDGVHRVFHLAAQPGIRGSWASGFDEYLRNNVLATQRLLEAVRSRDIDRFVYASSSSVYGDAVSYPCEETDLPRPHSPYGVTKLGAEHLCGLYARNYGVPTVSLRYFTVYGPRQRPDMAMHRMIEAAITGAAFPVFGSGDQIRDFTFVGDVVNATTAAGEADAPPGTTINVAGGTSTGLNDVIEVVERVSGRQVPREQRPAQPGDVERTGGATDCARSLLGWTPGTTLEEGLRRQTEWHLRRTRT